jgi:hypothetical protein
MTMSLTSGGRPKFSARDRHRMAETRYPALAGSKGLGERSE